MEPGHTAQLGGLSLRAAATRLPGIKSGAPRVLLSVGETGHTLSLRDPAACGVLDTSTSVGLDPQGGARAADDRVGGDPQHPK